MAAGDDAVRVAPDVYTVLFENDRVRVLDVRLKAGAKSAMHSHPDSVNYLFSPGKAKFTTADGTTQEAEFPTGAVVWQDAQAHAVENIGSTDVHALSVELK